MTTPSLVLSTVRFPVPNGPTIDLETVLDPHGKTQVLCDLCNNAIALTINGGFRYFVAHRGKAKCKRKRRVLERTDVATTAQSARAAISTSSMNPEMSTRAPGPLPIPLSHRVFQSRPISAPIAYRTALASSLPSSSISTPFSGQSASTTPSVSRIHSPSPFSRNLVPPMNFSFAPSNSPPFDPFDLPPSDDTDTRDSDYDVSSPDRSRAVTPSQLGLHSEDVLIECTGALVEWVAGSVWDSYPYHQHQIQDLPWEPIGFSDNKKWIRLRSKQCSLVISGENELISLSCSKCDAIPHSSAFQSFSKRAVFASEHTPWLYLNQKQLHGVLVKVTAQLRTLRLRLHNIDRKLSKVRRKTRDHERIIMFLATHDVRSLRRLLAVALRNGSSPEALLALLRSSIAGLYNPRGGFSRRDYDIAFIVKALGGPRLLHALYKAEGYPSVPSLMQNYKIHRLLPSIKTPSDEEINLNISSFFGPASKALPPTTASGECPGQVLMVDGVALEGVCRYDADRDSVIGLCREHTADIDVRVRSTESVDAIEKALYIDETCCHGVDGTVVALAPIADSEHYTPIPVVLSSSCKSEKGNDLAKWIGNLIKLWSEHPDGACRHGDIKTFATDGDASYRSARFILGMSEALDPESSLGQLVYPLAGLNCQTGKSGLQPTSDPKHVFKRFATIMRSPAGILIIDTSITPSQILEHLKLSEYPRLTPEQATELMNPADKQNVPKAVNLIQALLGLEKSTPSSLSPPELHRRKCIIFLAKVFGAFLLPFISIDMSLSEQVCSLSKYAHLVTAMHLKNGLAFLTGALYADSQAVVKNVIFTIARLQLIDTNIAYFLIHEGTDRLEGLFSNVRTQDHSRNFDVLQLSQKLSIGAEISTIFERNPELDRGHRRLTLKDAKGVDHVNPRSWKGDVCVGNVDLKQEWYRGRDDANQLLTDYFGESERRDFAAVFSQPGVDHMRPNGGSYIGSTYSPDDERSDLSEAALVSEPDATRSTNDESGASHSTSGMVPEGTPDLEDYLEQASQEDNSETPRFQNYLEFEGQRVMKSYYVPGKLTARRARKVSVRTFRVRGMTIEDLQRSSGSFWDSMTAGGENMFKNGDLAATLMRVGEIICVVVIEALSFEYAKPKKQLTEIPVDDLEEGGEHCVNVVAQIIELKPCEVKEEMNLVVSWAWTGKYLRFGKHTENERSTQKQYVLRIPGILVHPLGPSIQSSGSRGEVDDPQTVTWTLSHTELEEIRDYAWSSLNPETEEIISNIELLPTVNNCALPYLDHQCQKQLTVDSDSLPAHLKVTKLPADTEITCKLCGRPKIKVKNMRNHVGIHILKALRGMEEEGVSVGVDPCGWCGKDGCTVQLTKKNNGASTIGSSCAYHYSRMQYKAAQIFSETSPCTNVPVHCPICPPALSGQPRTFWKYNFLYHLATEHPCIGEGAETLPRIPVELLVDTFITSREELRMGIDEEATQTWREEHLIPDSDAINELRAGLAEKLKRTRAASTVDSEPARKTARVE